MADRHGRTLAKGCPKICGEMISREMVSLQMMVGSIYVLEMGYIIVSQTPQLLFGKKRCSLTNIAALPLVRLGCLHTITMANFYKKQTERVYGRLCTRIFNRKRYAPFLKLPEAQFSSVATTAFLNPVTMEKPGNRFIPEAG